MHNQTIERKIDYLESFLQKEETDIDSNAFFSFQMYLLTSLCFELSFVSNIIHAIIHITIKVLLKILFRAYVILKFI